VPNVKDLDQSTADRYVAEAKFLRAFFYFRLVKVFGGVPLITKANIENYQVPRSSKDSTYIRIENDLKDAESVLPLKSELTDDEVGRATKGAAEALLTRAYLMQGNYQAAEKWAKKIIDSGEYSLNPDYYSIFTEDTDHGPEAIFSINYAYNSKYSSSLDGMTTADDTYKTSRAFGGYGFDLPTQDLHDAFAPNDPRLKATMYADGDTLPDGRIGDVDNSSTGYIDKKAYIPEDEYHPAASGKDNKIFRLGEIYLWYAEAANEDGNTQEALKYLNKVRKRAREGNSNILPDITITDKNALRKEIYHEERVEYAMEAKRFFDLVRTGRAAEVLHAYAKKYNTEKGANFKKDNKIFPIPETQIELSQGTLEQNPGYD
jgi:tetratricopeptide (TPR) repeat protein